MAELDVKDGTGEVIDVPGYGLILAVKPTVPTDGAVGFAHGCLLVNPAGTVYSDGLYFNVGDEDSANFDAVGSIGSFARADMIQESAVVHPVPLTSMRIHDAISTALPATSSSNDLGLVSGTYLTSNPSLRTADVKATTVSNYARFLFPVPAHYVAGQAISLRINAGMVTTISDTTATLGVECARLAAPATNICATAAQDMNNLTAADITFTLTPTNVVVGDVLDVRLTIAVVDGASGTAVIGAIYSVSFLLSVKG